MEHSLSISLDPTRFACRSRCHTRDWQQGTCGAKASAWYAGGTVIGCDVALRDPEYEEVARLARRRQPPSTEFERLHSSGTERRDEGSTCFAVTLRGFGQRAIGLFQVRQDRREFQDAEWGFVLARRMGYRRFEEGAKLVLDFRVREIWRRRLGLERRSERPRQPARC